MARLPAETPVVVHGPNSTFRGIIEAAKRIPGQIEEWKYLVSFRSVDGSNKAGWFHESKVEHDG